MEKELGSKLSRCFTKSMSTLMGRGGGLDAKPPTRDLAWGGGQGSGALGHPCDRPEMFFGDKEKAGRLVLVPWSGLERLPLCHLTAGIWHAQG